MTERAWQTLLWFRDRLPVIFMALYVALDKLSASTELNLLCRDLLASLAVLFFALGSHQTGVDMQRGR